MTLSNAKWVKISLGGHLGLDPGRIWGLIWVWSWGLIWDLIWGLIWKGFGENLERIWKGSQVSGRDLRDFEMI